MTTILIIAALTLVAGGAYYWYTQNIQIHALKKKPIAQEKPKAKKKVIEDNEYRCVMIVPGSDACEAAKSLNKTPILMGEASALPVKGCNKAACDCRFTRHDDRRMDERRNDSYMAAQAYMNNASNKRSKQDRRQQTK